MTLVRGFARYMAGIDRRTEVPPLGLVGPRRRRHEPFIFSPSRHRRDDEPGAELRDSAAVGDYETLIGLFAATGMRVGEAITLDRGDIDWTDGDVADPRVEVRQVRWCRCTRRRWRRCDATPDSRDQVQPRTDDRRASSSPALGQPAGLCAISRDVPTALRQRRHRSRRAPRRRGSTICATHSRFATLLGWYRAGRGRRRPPAGAVDLSRASRPALHLLVSVGRAGAAGIGRTRAWKRRGRRARHEPDRPDAAGVLHRPARQAAPGQPAHRSPPTATRSGCCSGSPTTAPARPRPRWTGTTSTPT